MEIVSLRVKNFRTITTEQTLNLEGGLTLVGPNNSGKTNLLVALLMFFTGYENRSGYNYLNDLPVATREHDVKTSITCFFRGGGKAERAIFEKLAKLRNLLGMPEEKITEFSINVYFSNNTPSYQVYPGQKRPPGKSPQCSQAQRAFISAVLDLFQCYYIPSKKSISELYEEFVSPFVRAKVAEKLAPHDALILSSVSAVEESMNSALSDSGILDAKVSFQYPNNSLGNLISSFELYVTDTETSSIYSKGMGMQAAVLLSSFKWITSQQSKNVVWLIEEPETYMHPGLASRCAGLLDDLGEESLVIKTTHAINFVPRNISAVQGVRRRRPVGNTVVHQYESHRDATKDIKSSLGVRFCDYFGLSRYTLCVEGETDRIYIEHILGSMHQNWVAQNEFVTSRDFLVKDFTGVTDLKSFVKLNAELLKNEICMVSLFDGDTAGKQAIREITGFMSNKSGYNANTDYVLIPKGPVEILFSDEWIADAHRGHAGWFEIYMEDAEGGIEEIKIKDGSKKSYMKYMLDRFDAAYDYDGVEKFIKVLEVVNTAFMRQELI